MTSLVRVLPEKHCKQLTEYSFFHFALGIVFRHQDHNVRIIHKALVNHLDNYLVGKRLDAAVQEQLKSIRLSEKFDVRRTTFYFAVRLLTSLSSTSAAASLDEKTYELFEQNLYKISKAIHSDTFSKSATTVFTQLTGLSETLDINENVLNYIKTWSQNRTNEVNRSKNTNDDQAVTSTTKTSEDFLDSILNVLDDASPQLDEDDIAACVLDVIMHGSEMLKGALSWLLLYVVQYPEEADNCRREARSVATPLHILTIELLSSLVLVIVVIRHSIFHPQSRWCTHKLSSKKSCVIHLWCPLWSIPLYKTSNGMDFTFKNGRNSVLTLWLYIIQWLGRSQRSSMSVDGLERN